jgi:uncharacterized protein
VQVSAYNTYLEDENGLPLVFNNISGTILPIDSGVLSFLKGETRRQPSPLSLKKLYNARCLVVKREKETAYVHDHLQMMRQNTDTLQYTLVMTYRCNLSCPYCYEDSISERSGNMPQNTVTKVLQYLNREVSVNQPETLSLTLYGGEPLLNYQSCVRILETTADMCRENQVRLIGSLITNGVLLDSSKIKTLSKYLRLVQVTLEGGEAYHNRIRVAPGGQPTFGPILETIHNLIDEGISVNIRIQVSPDSLDSLPDCFERLDQEKLLHHPQTNIYFFPIMNIADVCSARSFSCCERYYEPGLFSTLWQFASRYPVKAAPPPAPAWLAPYCSFVNKGAWIIDPQGKKYKCVSMLGIPEGQCGHICDEQEQKHLDLYRQREQAFINRSGTTIAECRDCEHMPICDGGCAYLAQASNGRMESSYCDMHKQSIRDQLRVLFKKRSKQ